MNEKIGIIGFGNMGSSIAERIKSEHSVIVFDQDKTKTLNLSGIGVAENIEDLLKKIDVLLLAVKPQDLDHVLKQVKSNLGRKLVITIAAGISTQHIEKFLGNIPVVRAMPNLGAKIGESVTCVCRGEFATEEDFQLSEELLYHIGTTRRIKEELMNASTAISGSGMAYVFYFIEAEFLNPQNIPEHTRHDMIKRLQRSGESVGFGYEDAMFLAVNTVNSGITLIKKLKLPPAELIKQIASKGGTTEAALAVLRRGSSWEEAAQAALKKAQELARRD